MKSPRSTHDWSRILIDERPVERFSPHGRYRLALAYANTYHVAMSSLGFQRVYELVFFLHGVENGLGMVAAAQALTERGPDDRVFRGVVQVELALEGFPARLDSGVT